MTEIKCECCEETIDENGNFYTVKLESYSNGVEEYDFVCNDCLSAWFTECPEDIIKLEVSE